MDEAHRRDYLQNRYEDDELIEELDRRLGAQGFDTNIAGVKIVVEYLRDGWSVVALPPEMANQFDGVPGVGSSIHKLAAELRRNLAGVQECDGCEEKKAGTITVGEEVLCADCIVARSKEEVDRLRGAIAEHRRLMHMRDEGRRISSVVADRDLWAALEED